MHLLGEAQVDLGWRVELIGARGAGFWRALGLKGGKLRVSHSTQLRPLLVLVDRLNGSKL